MLLPPPWYRYLLAAPVNFSPRPTLHSFSSTPYVLHVQSISCSLLIIILVYVITANCKALHCATGTIPSSALITPFSKKPMFFPLVVPRFIWLVAGFPPRRPDLAPRTSNVRFVFSKVALERVTERHFCITPHHSSITQATEIGPLQAADQNRNKLIPMQRNTNQ
jgi:hypothetical protein